MEARNRTLPEWFNRIRTGQLRLPRFQRHEAWGHKEVAGLLETVLRGLPSGAALILEVGDSEPFVSRPIADAPAPTERVTEHLLDGQQRLTALWRAFNDGYEDRTYFAFFDGERDHQGALVPHVEGEGRWRRGETRYPLWADVPAQVAERGRIPLKLLRPGDLTKEIHQWCEAAAGGDTKVLLEHFRVINGLRERVAVFPLPFLSLPVGTPPDIALDVFIKMNTSAVQLSPFDIVVAQVEDAAGQSLHDLVAALKQKVPAAAAYANPADWVLGAAALRENRSPGQASYLGLDFRKLATEWERSEEGIKFAVEFLEEEHVYDAERLPTGAVLAVLAALHEFVPSVLDARGNAKALLRKYLWHAFLTRRYENAAATHALQDFRGLRDALAHPSTPPSAPIFDGSKYPLPTAEELRRAGWPKGRDILARGVLAAALRGGAFDLADGSKVSRDHLRKREYHHLFPDALLAGDGKLERERSYLALNCALITWNTNRTIAAKEPVKYLKQRVENATLGEEEVRARLATHAVPFDELNVGGYDAFADPEQRAEAIQGHYDRFLAKRAELILRLINKLCGGYAWAP
ncbi:MAG TPA: DUF262 domain-containing protein [Polyangiaceae bacterium]|nr:DUF262 domain-containing protein [Polyangiaceae bacterium]